MTNQNILNHVKKNPGVRADQIAAHFEAEVPEVSKALKALRAEGLVRKRGNTRGATYTAKA